MTVGYCKRQLDTVGDTKLDAVNDSKRLLETVRDSKRQLDRE